MKTLLLLLLLEFSAWLAASSSPEPLPVLWPLERDMKSMRKDRWTGSMMITAASA